MAKNLVPGLEIGDGDPYEALVMCVISVAVQDAQSKNGQAADARAFFAGPWFEHLAGLLDLSPEFVARLRDVVGPAPQFVGNMGDHDDVELR